MLALPRPLLSVFVVQGSAMCFPYIHGLALIVRTAPRSQAAKRSGYNFRGMIPVRNMSSGVGGEAPLFNTAT